VPSTFLPRYFAPGRFPAGGCNTLCHGDLWRGNLMFKDGPGGPECLLVDFQMLRYASPCLDLAMLLYVHATPETRIRFETPLLERYYLTFREALLDAGLAVPDHKRFLEDYEARRLFGMTCVALRWPAAVVTKLNDPRALESWYLDSRIETYRSLMDADPAYEATMEACLKDLFAESKRISRLGLTGNRQDSDDKAEDDKPTGR
jgi:Ser/Thr protein kinase RdoA (MazF antagonist)